MLMALEDPWARLLLLHNLIELWASYFVGVQRVYPYLLCIASSRPLLPSYLQQDPAAPQYLGALPFGPTSDATPGAVELC
jgi:hypothetical protein